MLKASKHFSAFYVLYLTLKEFYVIYYILIINQNHVLKNLEHALSFSLARVPFN